MATTERPEDEIERAVDQDDETDEHEDEDDCDTEDEDEDDEDRRTANETEREGGASDVTPAVPNDDPELHAFLSQVVKAPVSRDLLGVLADKLADRNDDRSELVRDLAAPGVCPEVVAATSPVPVVAARFWAAYRCGDRVRAAAHHSTALHRAISAATAGDRRTWPRRRPATAAEARVPAREGGAEGFWRALDQCRLRLLLALFGTSPEKLRLLRVVKTSDDLQEVKGLLYGRQRADTIPWMTAVYKNDRRRFAEVLAALLADPDLRRLGCAVMDAVGPEWPALIASRLTTGE